MNSLALVLPQKNIMKPGDANAFSVLYRFEIILDLYFTDITTLLDVG